MVGRRVGARATFILRISIDWAVQLAKNIYTDPGCVDLEYFVGGILQDACETSVREIREHGVLHFYRVDIGLVGDENYLRAPCLWRETQSGKESWHVSADD